MAKYRQNLAEFIEKEEKSKTLIREGLFADLKAALPAFVSEFRAINFVAVVGSFASKDFSKESDVDILVRGLDKAEYFRCMNFFEKRLGRKIDLILDEDISEKEREHLLKNMETIYDGQKV